ncbi:hypothetical protein F3J28_09060 [Enterobacter sp. Ap-1006]|nr:hypothetical protein [Enterobacter sp. Ap-1006]
MSGSVTTKFVRGAIREAKASLFCCRQRGEKAWFFPLCGYQPKINALIFRFFDASSGISSLDGGLSEV